MASPRSTAHRPCRKAGNTPRSVAIGLSICLGLGVAYALGRLSAQQPVKPPGSEERSESGDRRAVADPDVQRDIEALVSGEGRLPPDYVPAGSMPPSTGATLLAGATLVPAPVEAGATRAPAFRIESIQPGSLAAQGGLRVGDLIIDLDGAAPTESALARGRARLLTGSKLQLEFIRREGQVQRVRLGHPDRPK